MQMLTEFMLFFQYITTSITSTEVKYKPSIIFRYFSPHISSTHIAYCTHITPHLRSTHLHITIYIYNTHNTSSIVSTHPHTHTTYILYKAPAHTHTHTPNNYGYLTSPATFESPSKCSDLFTLMPQFLCEHQFNTPI